jgi:hypothetical protein
MTTLTIKTTVGNTADLDINASDITIADLLSRVADPGDATTTYVNNLNITGVRGLTLVERALLSAIRGLKVSTALSLTNPWTYVKNTTAVISAPSATALPRDGNSWVNVSDVFLAAPVTTTVNSIAYLADVGDLSANRALEIDEFKITLTHDQQNIDHDFELKLVLTDDVTPTELDLSTGPMPPITVVRTGPVHSTFDGKISRTVTLRGYIQPGYGGVSADQKFLVIKARLASGAGSASFSADPKIYVQTDSTNLAYRIITA